MTKQLCLGGFMRPICLHTAWWRHPSAPTLANFNWPVIRSLAQKLEHACFDAVFTADHLAVMPMPPNALKRSGTITSYDPLVMLSAIAACTDRIGLIATGTTSYEDPYLLARRFASLDHLSGGRAGWNIVTTVNPEAALNFGLETALRHAERYERAEEFFDVVTGLWDGWSDHALVMDKEAGVFSDLDKIRPLNHKGKFFSVKGPLNIARPVQGWPVIALAGASEEARDMAARSADLVFGNARSIETGRAFYRDVKSRAVAAGRNPDHVKILPANQVYVGRTRAEALAKKRYMDDLVHVDSNIPNLSIRLGIDCSKFDPDKPLPELPHTEQGQGNQREWAALARREGLTVRELAKRAAESGTGEMVGTASEIADQMEEWLMTEACDGFIVVFYTVPDGYDDFVTMVVPELQRRGLFRTRYEGTTLREHIGLPRPKSPLD
ncbi:monooxygenase [Burkholderia cepacia]|uniref:LLM class flavin-dependent oxidoreductase n=1 Tax=Burkholderia cepacia TaxID=292 RepID=UPI00075A63F3|nr:LLM class flavin-dependent oxidoreductase [Burkholderia cepacia]KVA27799.1 monooxygenase [Burkholderia cepacia]KVA40352.1 monooxygenase [Burkholderia cepacia]